MTFDASRYPAHLLKIRYVDPPRGAVPVRRHSRVVRRVAVVATTAAILLVAAIGVAAAARTGPGHDIDSGPVPGEFRLGPGNQLPPGYVVPLGKGSDEPVPVVEPDVQWRPSLVPLDGGLSLSIPKPGDILVGPKPPGRVPTA